MRLILALAGCLSFEDGMARRGEMHCAWMDACGQLEAIQMSLDACEESARNQPYVEANCPGYDAGGMQDCLDAYEAAIADQACDEEPAECASVCG